MNLPSRPRCGERVVVQPWSMGRHLMFALVASFGVVLAGVVGQAVPAWACTCAQQSQVDFFAAADAVFTGVPTGSAGTDPVVWSFAVDEAQKGDVASSQAVQVSHVDTEDCDFRLEVGTRYQVFAGRTADSLKTGTCTGTRPLRAGSAPPYDPGDGGPPQTPAPTVATTVPAPTAPQSTSLTTNPTTGPAGPPGNGTTLPSPSSSSEPLSADGDGVGMAALVVGGLTLCIAAGAAAIVWRRRDSSR